MPDELSFRSFGKYRQVMRQHHIFENPEIARNGFSFNLTLPGNFGLIQHRSMGETYRLKETGKISEVSDKTFMLDFFLQVKINIPRQ